MSHSPPPHVPLHHHAVRSHPDHARLRNCLILHVVLWPLLLLRMLRDILSYAALSSQWLDRLALPDPFTLEYLYLWSVVPAILALTALRLRSITRLQLSLYLLFATTVFPLVSLAGFILPGLLRQLGYTQMPDPLPGDYSEHPLVVLYCAAIVVSIQVHTYQLYTGNRLLGAWERTLRSTKKAE